MFYPITKMIYYFTRMF